jgi:hypothetical protein
MKTKSHLCLTAAALLAALCTHIPAPAQAGQDLNIQFPDSADHCADVKASASGQLARAEETFTLSRKEVSVLEVNGADHGNIRVRGWDQPDYSVEACRIAATGDRLAADRLLKSISVTRSGARFSSSGPGAKGEQWLVVFIVHAPKGAALDLETNNGPVGLRAVNGNLKVRVKNGPVSFQDCSGTIAAQSANGPISFAGGSGDVTLGAANGPISLRLSGEDWNGPRLEARTTNGPLSATLPNSFRAGVRVEASRGAPLSCRLDACASAVTDASGNRRVLQLNGRNATVSLSTGNGPVSLGAPRSSRSVI